MTGFQSRVRDVINQAAPVHATVAVADRGLSQFLDPSMTGVTRFMQKAGTPFPLLTPQMSALLTSVAAAGATSVVIAGARLLSWLRPGMLVSFELLEQAIVASVSETATPGELQVNLTAPLLSSHAVGTRMHIRGFTISVVNNTVAGDGGLGAPTVLFSSPFLLAVGDVLNINGARFTLSVANEVSVTPTARTVQVKVEEEGGLPALTPSDIVFVQARAAYRSEVLTVPQALAGSLIQGPIAVDWVSGPMVADYLPSPESEVFIEEFDNANNPIAEPRAVAKNDTLLRFPIMRDQMLFWRIVEGSVNWNATYMELHAFDSGRAHLWTPCRPPLDPAPLTTTTAVVPAFAPYAVLLLSHIVPNSVVVLDEVTKAVIPSTDYTVNEDTGTISFTAAHASEGVIITYRPRIEWQVFARPSVDNVELTITVGREPKQVFTLGAAGSSNILTVQVNSSDAIDQLHVTARKADDSGGAYKVEMGDWQQRGSTCAAIRYTLTTGADVDYDWASSGLLVKPLWPTLELLRARLDGESLFARFLNNGRMLL